MLVLLEYGQLVLKVILGSLTVPNQTVTQRRDQKDESAVIPESGDPAPPPSAAAIRHPAPSTSRALVDGDGARRAATQYRRPAHSHRAFDAVIPPVQGRQ